MTAHLQGDLPSNPLCTPQRHDRFPCKPSHACGSATPSNSGVLATAVESRDFLDNALGRREYTATHCDALLFGSRVASESQVSRFFRR